MRITAMDDSKESLQRAKEALAGHEVIEVHKWDDIYSVALVDMVLVSERIIDAHWSVLLRPGGSPVYEQGVEEVLESLANLDHALRRTGIGILTEGEKSSLARLVEARARGEAPLLGGHIRIALATREEGWKVLAEKLLGQSASAAP